MNTINKLGIPLNKEEMKKVVGGSTKTAGFAYTCWDNGTDTLAFAGCYDTYPSIPCGLCHRGHACDDAVSVPDYVCG